MIDASIVNSDHPIDSALSVHRLASNEGRIAEGGARVKTGLAKSASITVIVVVFNGADAIKKTVRRISSLCRNDIDLIVVDGGSRDGTVEFLKENDSQIDYWVSESDGGIYDAMNKGWSLANLNSHVIYVGAGDYLISLPDTLTLTAGVIFYGDVFLGNSFFRSSLSSRIKMGNTLHHQALLIPKALHPSPPFDLGFKVYADYDFNLRLFKQGHQFLRSDALKGYALPGGVSATIKITEASAVVCKNYGYVWGGMSFLYGALLAIKCKLRATFRP